MEETFTIKHNLHRTSVYRKQNKVDLELTLIINARLIMFVRIVILIVKIKL